MTEREIESYCRKERRQSGSVTFIGFNNVNLLTQHLSASSLACNLPSASHSPSQEILFDQSNQSLICQTSMAAA